MAKPNIRSGMTDSQIAFLQQCGEEICDKMSDTPLEVEGIPQVSILTNTDEYRRKELIAGQGFFMKSAYVGAKGILIFQLIPEDSQDYKMIEVLQTVMDDIFPLAGSILADISDIRIPKEVEEQIMNGGQVIKIVMSHEENFDAIANTYIAKRANEKTLDEELSVKEYENNPTFGVF